MKGWNRMMTRLPTSKAEHDRQLKRPFESKDLGRLKRVKAALRAYEGNGRISVFLKAVGDVRSSSFSSEVKFDRGFISGSKEDVKPVEEMIKSDLMFLTMAREIYEQSSRSSSFERFLIASAFVNRSRHPFFHVKVEKPEFLWGSSKKHSLKEGIFGFGKDADRQVKSSSKICRIPKEMKVVYSGKYSRDPRAIKAFDECVLLGAGKFVPACDIVAFLPRDVRPSERWNSDPKWIRRLVFSSKSFDFFIIERRKELLKKAPPKENLAESVEPAEDEDAPPKDKNADFEWVDKLFEKETSKEETTER